MGKLPCFPPGSEKNTFQVPDSVTSIEEWAFYERTSLTEVTVPDSVTSIGKWAFDGCRSLTKITIPDSVTSIGDNAFDACPVTIIATPGSYAWKFAQKKGIKVVAADKE